MAQLYKLRLYVCDLDENLSLSDIKSIIEDVKLNNVWTNCVCHFSDEKVGKKIEWQDNIDINRIDCPTSAWEKYF